MPSAATRVDLEIIILSEVSERQMPYKSLICGNYHFSRQKFQTTHKCVHPKKQTGSQVCG